MKKNLVVLIILLICSIKNYGQINKKEADINAIKNMCGCYDVKFKYTETFASEIDYEKHHDYTASALELAELIIDEDNKLSIQHLLIVNDTMVIKHWRQDWEYENTNVFYYDKDNNWKFNTLAKKAVKGQWTQKVYQVDDSPRYSGSATWIHADGKHYWENKTDSPLPRREYSKRTDYNVMLRGNRHEITKNGWFHEQDNDKIIRKDGKKDVLVVQEKGYNTYLKVADNKCNIAKEWWKKNYKFWSKTRKYWNNIYDRKGNLTLKKIVDEKPLYKHLYKLKKEDAKQKDIAEILMKFIVK